MAAYQYQQLKEREIRLLILSAGEYNSGLSGMIRHVSIDNPRTYEALSYTWGDSGGTRYSISCDNRRLEVTSNLNLALLRLRNNAPHITRTLWIDQLCINQANTDERNQQVSLMGDIYRKARQVDVWLGEEDDETAIGLSLLPKLLAAFREGSGDGDDLDDEVPDLYTKFGLPFIRSARWTAFAQLFARPYFRRMWVVQEVALGSKVIVYCGSHSVNWEDLAKSGLCLLTDFTNRPIEAHKVIQIIRAYRKQKIESNESELIDFLFNSYNLQCFDPRDKIYGMLGLVTGGLDIKPNYHLSVHKVYTSFTKNMMVRGSSLAILCNVLHPKCLEGLPSWVPDWTAITAVRQSFGSRTPKHRNTAAAYEKAVIRFSADEQEVYLKGTVVGTVRAIGSVMPESSPDQVLPEWEGLAQSVLPYHPTGEDFPTVFWRTLIASDAKHDTRSSDVLQNRYESWNNLVEHKRDYAIAQVHPEHEIPPWQPIEPINTVSWKAQEFERMVEDASFFRRIYATDNGFLGLAPAGAREGDQLCILYGGPVPFILRQMLPTTNKYTLVGECFALGLMDSEGLDANRFLTQQFELR